jgi:hypothetical protein
MPRRRTRIIHYESRIAQMLPPTSLVRLCEYLLSGADKSAIPKTFQAKPDRHGRYLNHFSCNFWNILFQPSGMRGVGCLVCVGAHALVLERDAASFAGSAHERQRLLSPMRLPEAVSLQTAASGHRKGRK